jgi:hypothetical protein
MPIKIFNSIGNNHSISINLINETDCYYDLLQYNPDDYKCFVLLIKEIIEYLHKNKIKYIYYSIPKNLYFDSFITIENDETEYEIVIKTTLNEFVNQIIQIHNIQQL